MKNSNRNVPISVLMPAYNAQKSVSVAIESILTQTFSDFELIIGDDCSTDSTWKLIQEFAKQDHRIVAFRNRKNLYIAGNRNELLKRASGKYIAWQDADDISFPERLEQQYKFMQSHPEVGIVGGYLQFFDNTGSKSLRKYATDDRKLRKNIFKFSPVAQPVAMIRKKVLDKAGKYNLDYPPAEDIDMSFRLGLISQFANIPKPLLKYRLDTSSNTYRKLKKIELTTIKIRRQYANNPCYPVTPFDYLYNLVQFVTAFMFPAKIRIQLFNLIRNSKS